MPVCLSHAYVYMIVSNVLADMSVIYQGCCLVSDCTVTDHIHVFFLCSLSMMFIIVPTCMFVLLCMYTLL